MSPKSEEEEEKKVTVVKKEVITAVYKLNLHCKQCAFHVKKPLLATQGKYELARVHSVIVDVEKGELKVKGVIEVKEIHKVIEKISKRKVEFVTCETESKKVEQVKQTKEIVRTTTIKVHLHCTKCEIDLKKKLLKHKGIHVVKTDTETQTVTIEGTIESEKLLTYMRKRVHKRAEIIVSEKENKKKEESECSSDEEDKETNETESCSDDKETTKCTTSTTKVIETMCSCRIEARKCSRCCCIESIDRKCDYCRCRIDCEKTVCVQHNGGVPYFVHYVYAPQFFSDENPNSCSLM
ncbi:Heavy metal-associated isoprenylated plant protein 4 [Linum grandiflorum]